MEEKFLQKSESRLHSQLSITNRIIIYMAKKISKKVIERVDAYARLISKDIPISGVYIFGSHAKGTARPDSDIDVAIVSRSFGKNSHEEGKWLQRKLWDAPYSNMDVVGYSPSEFKTGQSPLLAEIRKTAVAV